MWKFSLVMMLAMLVINLPVFVGVPTSVPKVWFGAFVLGIWVSDFVSASCSASMVEFRRRK